MGDVHYIVDKLNAPPFSYNVSLVAISEKNPRELLQLLSDVFSRISPKHQNVDVAKEAPEQTAGRLLEFLKIIKYRPYTDANTFRQLLVAGDREAVYPVLKWVLPQPQVLEKRAFVGYYLSFPDMPEEMNFDSDIVDTKEDIKQLHQQFIEVHRQCEQIRSLSKDSQALKAKIKALEDEKERLVDKVAKAKERASVLPEKAAFLEACSALRRQQGEEVALSQQLQAQRAQLERAEAAHQKAVGRLRELQSSATDGSATRLLEGLQEEVAASRFQVSEKFPKEMERKQKRMQALQEVLQNNVNNEVDLQRLQQQGVSLQQDIQAISDRRAAAERAQQGNKAFLQVKQAQQMLTVVARKRDDLQAKLDRLQEKKSALTAQFERQAVSEQLGGGAAGAGVGAGAKVPFSEEEWRQKYESMKQRLPTYKKMKRELGDLEAELLVLARTLEVLAAQEQALSQEVEKTERSHGVQGFAKTVTSLEKVSEAKSAIDEAKGATLEEISRTVSEIIAAIKDRKDRLAPKIKQLHSARQQLRELEEQHAEKKSSYDAAVAAADSKTASLEAEVSALRSELAENESKYHLLHCQLHIMDSTIKRLTTPTNMERLKDKYQGKVAEAEDAMKELKERQRAIKDTHSSGLSQIDMMTDLLKLLQAKLSLHQGEALPLPQSFNTPTANVMVL